MSIYGMRTKFAAGLKVVLIVVMVVFVIGAFWQFGSPGMRGPEKQKGEGRTIATVNGENIPLSAFTAKWESVREQASQQGIKSPLVFADIRASIITNLIQGQQLMQVAREMGVDVSKKSVENEINKLVTEGLKANRRQVLGDLSEDQEASDPMKDSKYRSALASVGQSVTVQEQMIRSRVPFSEIQAQLVQDGIMKKVEVIPASISDQDVKDSYKTYNIKYILMQKGKISDEQLLTKAQSVVKEAREGKDFTKLAAANSDLSDKDRGSPAEYSFENRYLFPPEVGESVKMLKSGQISDPLNSDFGYFIVQLIDTKDNYPAKMDEKTTETRKKDIAEYRQNEKLIDVQKALSKEKDVKVLDPEFNGYWLIAESMKHFSEPEKSKKLLKDACASFEEALKSDTAQQAASDIVRAKLAQVLAETGETDKAITVLSQMIEGDSASVVSPDMSLMLGDLYVKAGKKDKALVMLKDASDMARHDIELRNQIVESYKNMGRNDLATEEKALIAKKENEIKIWQDKNKGDEVPSPGKLPVETP